ncbi:hypothetical protein KC19_1G209600 [Ceratodon purpureus]|uniref:Uncharacterized protein n=1 Tax=Ceratodon purpureus TaxID=3225 RepID=A0A8T0J899_CERPU|nr:hypothetical protein KC19_1G209600 [Ceratodon purpureus]
MDEHRLLRSLPHLAALALESPHAFLLPLKKEDRVLVLKPTHQQAQNPNPKKLRSGKTTATYNMHDYQYSQNKTHNKGRQNSRVKHLRAENHKPMPQTLGRQKSRKTSNFIRSGFSEKDNEERERKLWPCIEEKEGGRNTNLRPHGCGLSVLASR